MTERDRPRVENIPGYPGYYASEDGKIISYRLNPPKILSQRLHNGYYHVNIKTGSGRKTKKDEERRRKTKKKEPVHKLVLLAFVGPKPSQEYQCRHLDGNPTNNHINNLKWGTGQENAADSIRHGTHPSLKFGAEHNAAKLTEEQVLEIYKEVHNGATQKVLADRYGIDQKHVSDIKLQKTWKHLWGPRAGQISRK